MNIFLREMKANRKSLIIWCISLFVLTAGGMAKYAAFAESGDLVNQMMESLPEVLKTIWGIGTINLTQVKGYYSVLFIYFVLMATIHASMLGATIISKEERDKTAEFLLTKPTTRVRIVTSKLLAALVNILIFNIATLIFSMIFVNYYNKGEPINKEIITLMIAMFILQLLFVAIGTAMGAISKKTKVATAGATAILLGTYILSVYIDMNDKVKFLKYITPFKYFQAKELIFGDGFNIGYIILSFAIIGVLLGVTYRFYSKRDIYI
ncbi:ABC transporter [Caloranaerobacter sp. TR13]|uniref:ABC transporter permease subunit n=1 Tax=Caloranaerobacter sp. TR13 TaxID=1302151 RepID=UPI0006D45100|nr:ABC transporter permease subunit [Caloranaerobacter sp. TR13]KPU26507.1 ABC transporter [Caloranaerobacter sp. TR13]